jgi:glycosyltransferase involved in cell wall biosynthesis
MNELSIAHVLSSFGMGGQERVALGLAQLQRAQGHRVLALSLSDGAHGPLAELFQRADVATASVPKRGPSFDPTLALRISQYLREVRVDVVHTHNPHALVYGAPAAVLASAPCVHTKHGINPDSARRKWLRRVASKMVGAYVAVTPTLARVAIVEHECDPTQLHVIPNGIDTSRFRPDLEARRRVRAQLGIADNAWVVGTVGRLAPEKNQGLLIDAMGPMLDPRRHLVIVGDGPERQHLAERAQATLRPELVHFTGPRQDIEQLLSAFDVFALTSESEGLPLVLLEAMAAGLPVVSTAVGGVPDLVEDQVTGFLVEPASPTALMAKLIWLSSRPQKALDVAATARGRVLERHSTEHMTAGYQALYTRLARRARDLRPTPLVANG